MKPFVQLIVVGFVVGLWASNAPSEKAAIIGGIVLAAACAAVLAVFDMLQKK